MPTRGELLRLRAEECRVLADAFREGKLRVELLLLAYQYELLADSIERIKGTAAP